MWGLFSKDPAKDFPFETGEQIGQVQLGNKSVWQLFNGKNRSSGEEVSVFTCDLKDGASQMQLDVARVAVKRLKTLKHPSILTYISSVETDKCVLLATEPVQPLALFIDSLEDRGPKRDNYLAWGLFQVTRALAFLLNDAKLKHNNIHSHSVFVNRGGDWKVSGLEYVCNADQEPPLKILPGLEKYDPPEKKDPSRSGQSSGWSTDVWGLGCLIWEVYNGQLKVMDNLGTLGDIPKGLCPVYKECVGANPRKRPNPEDLVTKLRRSPGFFKNELVDTLIFMEEIQFKEDGDKTRFFSSLPAQLDGCPDFVAKNKILPQLINAFEYSNAGSSILAPVFKIGKKLDSKDYQERIVPCIVKLFSSNDRNARFKLLSQIEHFVEHLSPKIVNDQVFPKIESGFLDSEPLIREKTVIAMIHLAPKLSYSNLDEIVILKHFTRLVRDEQGGIRTNTVVCLGKIARYLHPKTRQNVLLACFARTLKDPFPPTRIAALNAIAATQQYYTVQETGCRVVPALVPATVDPEKPVRDQAFRVVRGFLSKLEKVSDDPTLREEMEKEVGSTSPVAAAAAGWATWAVGAVTAKFYKSASINQEGTPPPPDTAASAVGSSSAVRTAANTAANSNSSSSSPGNRTGIGRGGGGGASSGSSSKGGPAAKTNTDDGWDIDDDWKDEPKAADPVSNEDGDGWEDDGDWGELEVKPPTGGSRNAQESKAEPGDDWGSFASNTADRGHDPFADFPRGKPEPLRKTIAGGTSGPERKSAEERKLERQREIEAKRAAKKGPMKLGAKKLGLD